MLNKSVWVVIPAAGVGKRMQSATPKQYLNLHGKTVLEHTLNIFLHCKAVNGIVVALGEQDEYWPSIAPAFADRPVYTTLGGKERADSVLNGLNYLVQDLQAAHDSVVLVHDAARPCLSQHDLQALLNQQAHAKQGAILATPVRDTMKRAVAGFNRIAHTESRTDLWHALTPQMAELGVLLEALSAALAADIAITDEASALEWVGLQPLLVEGDARNIKITQPADLALAAFFLQAAQEKHSCV